MKARLCLTCVVTASNAAGDASATSNAVKIPIPKVPHCGIRAGQSIATAARLLGTEPPFRIGLNYWYLARKAGYTAVLKVRGTVVQELGIADNALTKTRKTQNVLMHSFY